MTPTLPEQISAYLSDQILSGTIKPGQKIEEAAITKKFKVSRTPVREAIRLVAASGLIKIEPRRGATAVAMNLEQLTQMFEALVEIEALCAKYCARRITAFEQSKLSDIHSKFQTAIKAKDGKLYSELNEEFHKLIYSCAHNETLENIALNMWQQLSPYRRNMFFTRKERMKASYKEHQKIVEAIMSSNQDTAYAAMYQHVTNSSVNAIDHLRQTMP